MVKRFQLWLLLLVLVLPVLPVQAKGPLLPLAVVYNDSLYMMNGVPRFEEELPQVLRLVSDVPTEAYRAIWSPDGTKLAYTISATDNRYGPEHKLMVWDGTQSIELWTGMVALDVPLAWTRDGLITFMALAVNEGAVNVYTIAPQAGAVPDLVINGLSVMLGCGIGTNLPTEGQLWRETTAGGIRPTLALTDYGLIYPAQCGMSISLYRPFSAETVPLAGGNLSDAVLSADEARVAGISNGQIIVIDLNTMEETPLTTTATASVLAWGRDGSLYYAAARQTRNVMEGFTPEQLTPFVDLMGADTLGGNTVSIYRIAPDGTEMLLHEQDAYAVGRMALKETTLVYSTIPNGDAWVKAVVDGTITLDALPEQIEGYVSPAVSYLALSETGAVLEAGTIPGALRQVAVSKQG